MSHTEFEYEFMVALQTKLKEKIEGGILTKVLNGDVLFIRIRHNDDLDWYYTYPNLAERIVSGWSTDEAVVDIVKAYRCEVLKRYFK